MAVKYEGRIRYFELWNEPDAMFTGSPAQMVKLAMTARQALTEAEQALGKPGYFKLVGFTPTSLGMSLLDSAARTARACPPKPANGSPAPG